MNGDHDEHEDRMEDDEDDEEIISEETDVHLVGNIEEAIEPQKVVRNTDDDPTDPEIDIELLGQHIDRHIHIEDEQINAAIHENPQPDIIVIEEEAISYTPKTAPQKLKKKISWIDEGIEKHAAELKQAPAKKLLARMKEEPPQSDNGLAQYIDQLHKIGFDEDEIESILKEANIARMSEHVSELKNRVQSYLATHLHDKLDHHPSASQRHHDEKWLPAIHREALDLKLFKLNALRHEMEDEFHFIGFSLFDTYFYLLLWCFSILILGWFYCGYNCRLCYTRRKPIYRFHKY